MKTGILAISLAILVFFIAGCSKTELNDQALEQRPTPVSTPSRTPIPEPECDHFWKNSDCFNPYLCYDCDATRGEPLEHYWSEANFQEAARCVNCGEINGEPLVPNFTTHGLRINTTPGRQLRYTTIINTEPVSEASGLVTLMFIDIFESDFAHPERRGYEYITARFMITFKDEDTGRTGFRYMTGQLDFFGFDPQENAIAHEELSESSIPGFRTAYSKLNFFGTEYDYFIRYSQIQSQLLGDTWYVVFEYTFLVPAGYDGMVVYVSNAGNWTNTGNRVLSDNFDRDTLFFRLRAQTG